MKYFSIFTGIGGFELGFPKDWKCIGFSENDENCCKLLKEKFKEVENYGDATKINAGKLPDFDLLCGGFPCQAFTVAGNRRGFEDTRGTMFFEIARVLETKRPTYLFLENVKGLLSHNKGKTFAIMLQKLEELGYNIEWMVLNSKDFGVPQSRQRTFVVGCLREKPRKKILFVRTSDKNSERKIIEVNHGFHRYRTYSPSGVLPTLTSYQEAGYATCKVEFDNSIIRFLTPKEYERAQGFPDNWTKDFPDIIRYQMLGNAVSVPVIKAIVNSGVFDD